MDRRDRFLVIWATTLVGILALVAGVNTIVDPYDLFGWKRIVGVNELKPGTRNHVVMSKAYQIERAQPVTAIIGTSRAYLAVDAASPQWPESYRPVYNYGIPQTNMYEVLFRELRQAWGTGQLRHAVAVLEFPAFFEPDPPLTHGANQQRLMFLDDGQINPDRNLQHIDDVFLSVFSMGALVDSTRTVLAQSGRKPVLNLRADGTATEADFLDVARAEGMNALFSQKDMYYLERLPDFEHAMANWHGPMPNLGMLRDMVQFCLQHQVSLTFILASSHADLMEIFRKAGLWPYVEKLKVDIAQIVADAHNDSITAWDFVEYAPYTTETVPPPGDKVSRLKWFWESEHFQNAFAELMLRRVFSGQPDDFGAPLTLSTANTRNQFVRDQQRAYIGWRLACQETRPAACPLQFGDTTSATSAVEANR